MTSDGRAGLNLEAVLTLESKAKGFLFANHLSVFVYSPCVSNHTERFLNFCLPSIGTGQAVQVWRSQAGAVEPRYVHTGGGREHLAREID